MDDPKCNICGRPAVVHLQQLGDSDQKIELCELCARNYGVSPNDGAPFSVVKSISSALFNNQLGSSIRGVRCSQCGCTSESFREHNVLGCPQCYHDLEEELLPLLGRMQKSLQHVGKFPKSFQRGEPKPASTIDDLSTKLKRAINEERFEDAAKLRDQIRNLPRDERR